MFYNVLQCSTMSWNVLLSFRRLENALETSVLIILCTSHFFFFSPLATFNVQSSHQLGCHPADPPDQRDHQRHLLRLRQPIHRRKVRQCLFHLTAVNSHRMSVSSHRMSVSSIVRAACNKPTTLLTPSTNSSIVESFPCSDTQQSEIFLRSQQIFSLSGWELWQNMVILCVASAVLLLLCFLQLLRLSARR